MDLAISRVDGLYDALAALAEQNGVAKPNEWAKEAKRKILRAITHRKSVKLRDWSYETRTLRPCAEKTGQAAIVIKSVRQWRQRAKRPTLKRAALLVRLKVSSGALLSGQKRIPPPVLRRAVQLLVGAKPKPKKNPIELQALAIADAIRNDWVGPARYAGRPKGTFSHKIKFENMEYQVPLSVPEVISVVRPVIEELTGTELTASAKTLEVLLAAVKTIPLRCTLDSMARLVARSKGQLRAESDPCLKWSSNFLLGL